MKHCVRSLDSYSGMVCWWPMDKTVYSLLVKFYWGNNSTWQNFVVYFFIEQLFKRKRKKTNINAYSVESVQFLKLFLFSLCRLYYVESIYVSCFRRYFHCWMNEFSFWELRSVNLNVCAFPCFSFILRRFLLIPFTYRRRRRHHLSYVVYVNVNVNVDVYMFQCNVRLKPKIALFVA